MEEENQSWIPWISQWQRSDPIMQDLIENAVSWKDETAINFGLCRRTPSTNNDAMMCVSSRSSEHIEYPSAVLIADIRSLLLGPRHK
jgi:hypothetical protein